MAVPPASPRTAPTAAPSRGPVEGLTIPTSSDDIGQLQSQFATIKAATALVNAAKSDFPDETSAIQSSVDTLDSAVSALPTSAQTAAQIATIAADASAVVTSVNGFSDATASQCG